MKGYKHFIFDFDGVLCDSRLLAIEVFNEICLESFPQVEVVLDEEKLTHQYHGHFRSVLLPWLDSVDQDKFLRLHATIMRERSGQLNLFEGISEVLNLLEEKTFSIVTGSFKIAVEEVLGRSRVDLAAVGAILGNETRQLKTRKIQVVLTELGIPACDAVYIGDLKSDILSCRQVPIDIISVGYGYGPIAHLENFSPDHLVSDVEELIELIRLLNRNETEPTLG